MTHLENAFSGKNSWWRYLLMVFLVGFVGWYIIGLLTTAGYVHSVRFLKGAELSSNQWVIGLMLFRPLIGILALWFLMKPLHKRNPITLINGTNTIRWKHFFIGFFAWLFFLVVNCSFDRLTEPQNIHFSFNPATFFPLLLIAFLVIPIQAGFEELTNRGYLLQGFAVLTKNRIFSIILVALLFALLHSFNTEVEFSGFLPAMLNYLVISLFFTLVTVLDDGVEIACGMHTVQNIVALTLWNKESGTSISSDSLFHIVGQTTTLGILGTFICALLCVFVLSKLFKWDWKVLWKKIE